MTYIKPQVIIHQEFDQPTEAEDTTLRAVIVGPNAILHRYDVAEEKAGVALGEYSLKDTNTDYVIDSDLGLSDGGIVDADSIKLYVDNAMLCYYHDLEQTKGNDTPTIHSSFTENNVIMSDNLVFRTNGAVNGTRSDVFGIRDVQIGDYVWCQANVGTTSANTHCQRPFVLSRITGYRYAPLTAQVDTPTTTTYTDSEESRDVQNGDGTTVTLLVKTPHEINSNDPVIYNPLLTGITSPEYTVTIISDQTTYNCARSVGALVRDNNTNKTWEIEIFENEYFDIGEDNYKGLIESFENLAVGNSWTVTESFDYATPELTTNDVYTGDVDDVYYLTCIRGGTPTNNTATCPVFSVRTALGLDYVATINITDTTTFVNAGRKGLKFKISGAVKTGQEYKVAVHSASEGPIVGLELQKDLPAEMRSADAEHLVALDIRLLKKTNIVLKADNETQGFPENFTVTQTPLVQKITVNGKIKLQDPTEFVLTSGTPITLELISGDMFLEYREWSPLYVGELGYCNSIADLSLIPGQLSPDNPLKYGVYKALANSNGVSVAYTAVKDPAKQDDWSAAFGVLAGEENVYSITPMTQDISVLNLAAALIESESGAEQCQWKTGVFSVKSVTECMIVGQNNINNDLFETSEDGKVVTATFEENIEDPGKFTIASIKSNNAIVSDQGYDVAAGDELRFMLDDDTYRSYTVDRVLTDTSVRLKSGPDTAVDTPTRIEIWRKLSKLEQAEYVGQLAASFASRRVMVVSPDTVGESGQSVPGYYLAASVSGYKSGINAYQGMTRTEISGFDDYSAAKPYWTESQLNVLAGSGVCVVVEDANGMPYIRHALTTDMTDVFSSEEVITRDYDFISKQIYSILDQYVGRTSVTTKTLNNIYSSVQSLLSSQVERGYIRSYTNLDVRQHALLADRVEVSVTLALPFPINVIEVYITAAKG